MLFLKIKLTDYSLQRISEIIADIGTVTAASVVIPALTNEFNFPKIIAGGLIAIFLWLFSIKISNTWIQ